MFNKKTVTQIKKMKNKLTLLSSVIFIMALVFFLSPIGTVQAATPSVDTVPAVVLKDNIQLNGNLTNLGGAASNNVYFEWGETVGYGNTTTPASQTVIGIFSDTIARTGLTGGATYHFRACADNAGDSACGADSTFIIGDVFEVCAACSYTTIQAGITAAVADNNDVVYVHAGTYTENVDVAKAHLTLEGEGRDVVTVNAAVSSDSVFEVTVNYVNISGFTIQGSTYYNGAGILVGNYNTISNNTIIDNVHGLHSVMKSNNNFVNNIISSNAETLYFYSSTSVFDSNMFLDNLDPFTTRAGSSEGTVGNQIDFNFTLKDYTGADCSLCAYEIELYPTEDTLQYSKTGALVTGNFTPTRMGIYSLRINVTDTSGNIESRKHNFLVNSTETTIDYYFRSVPLIHGQPDTYGLIGQPPGGDVGSLLLGLLHSRK